MPGKSIQTQCSQEQKLILCKSFENLRTTHPKKRTGWFSDGIPEGFLRGVSVSTCKNSSPKVRSILGGNKFSTLSRRKARN
jgi:hypothetical protein